MYKNTVSHSLYFCVQQSTEISPNTLNFFYAKYLSAQNWSKLRYFDNSFCEMVSMADCLDPDEMLQNAAFYLDPNSLQRASRLLSIIINVK